MSLRSRSLGLLSAATPWLRSPPRNPHRVVIPHLPLPTGKGRSGSADGGGSRATPSASEYHENKHIPPHTSRFLDQGGGDSLRRQEQLRRLGEATEAEGERIWYDAKPHFRKQQALVREMGVEGAVRETLHPSRTGFHEALRSRPLDRAILEEIYLGLHGKRVERRLKRGVSWEHWITKGDGTAPVFTTSRKGQQTFAFGGHLREVCRTTYPGAFPVLPLAAGQERKDRRGRRRLLDRDQCVPEVAFIGRTSSGKSSLINAIVNASVAPYGHLQGSTSALHFYSVAGKVVLVDCPGYGYYNPMQTPQLDAENAVKAMRAYLRCGARRGRTLNPQQEPKREAAATEEEEGEATEMAAEEGEGGAPPPSPRESLHGGTRSRPLLQPRNLKRVFVCVSARGMQHMDMAYCRLLEELGIPFTVVLTKTDAAPIRLLARLTDYTRCQLVHFTQCKELMLSSSLRLAGIDKLQSLIGSMAVTEDPVDGATMEFSSIV